VPDDVDSDKIKASFKKGQPQYLFLKCEGTYGGKEDHRQNRLIQSLAFALHNPDFPATERL
jgi:hypothetical protein